MAWRAARGSESMLWPSMITLPALGAAVAMGGTYGYELDLTKLSDEEVDYVIPCFQEIAQSIGA